MNVLEALGQGHGFTDGEVAIAEYLLAHADEISGMPIGTLASEMHRSKSSIVRLCRKIGLEGYRDLRIQIARDLERVRAQPRVVNPDRPFVEDSSVADITAAIAALVKQAIDATYSSLDIASVRKAAQLMLESRRVVYYALGDSCAAISVFVQLMYKLGVVCAPGLPMGDRGVLGRTLDSKDLAIIVTYSGNLVRTYRSTIDMLRARGCKTILITGNPSLGERMLGTDCIFLLPSGETREERLATFFSQACTQYVLNCIFSEAYTANYQGNLTNWHEEMLPFAKAQSTT